MPVTREQVLDPDLPVGKVALEVFVEDDGGDPADGIPVGFYLDDQSMPALASITGANGVARSTLDRNDITFRHQLESAQEYHARVDLKVPCADPRAVP